MSVSIIKVEENVVEHLISGGKDSQWYAVQVSDTTMMTKEISPVQK
jgi:hypothetical protein